MSMAEELTDKWRKMSLTDAEEEALVCDDEPDELIDELVAHSLAGKKKVVDVEKVSSGENCDDKKDERANKQRRSSGGSAEGSVGDNKPNDDVQMATAEDDLDGSDSQQPVVHFRSLERPKEDDFCLELSKINTYDEVVERVAERLDLDDPSKLRLTSHNCYSQQPKPQPIKYRGVDNLSDMLVHYNQNSDILYYEVLDIPLPELQGLKNLKVAFHHATKDEVMIHNIRLPKQSTVGDVIDELKTKVELSHPDVELRLLEVFYHKIYKIFPLSAKIENINDQYWTLRAEEVPEEEKNLEPNARLIHVYHFTRDTAQNPMQVQNFGEPFFLVIHEGETLADIKVRIQKKLRVPDEEFSKWKFAFLSLSRPEYLQDTDIVSSRFQRRAVDGAWEQYLGLEHTDTTPKRAYTVNQNRHAYEKPVKIYN